MPDVYEETEYYRGGHQHDRSPSHYGMMYHNDEFDVRGSTKMMQSRPTQPYKSEYANNNLNESRRFTTPERSLPMNQYADTAKSNEMNSAAQGSLGQNQSYRPSQM